MRIIKENNNQVFAEGVCFYKIFIIFLIGSVLGSYYEQFYILIRDFMRHGTIVWEMRRGLIYGPLNIIYGAGAAMMTIILARKKRPWYLMVLYGALLGGVLEFSVSFFQEKLLGTISWDYSAYILNIQGRTTIPIMMFWGLLSLLFTNYVYPKVSAIIERIPYKVGKIVTNILVLFIIFDVVITFSAATRQVMRHKSMPPKTIIGELIDKHYNDEFMKIHFSNAKKVKE